MAESDWRSWAGAFTQDVVAAAESMAAAAADGGAAAAGGAAAGASGAGGGAGADAAHITTVPVYRVPSSLRPLIGDMPDKDRLFTVVRPCPALCSSSLVSLAFQGSPQRSADSSSPSAGGALCGAGRLREGERPPRRRAAGARRKRLSFSSPLLTPSIGSARTADVASQPSPSPLFL